MNDRRRRKRAITGQPGRPTGDPAEATTQPSVDRRRRLATATRTDNTLTATFKEADLGNEPQVHVVLSATALRINPGGKHPKAVNKESVNAAGDFPVQNGKAEGTLSVTASFQLECSPPMTVAFTDVNLTDETSGITANIPGTF